MEDNRNIKIQQEGDNYPYHNPAPFVEGSKTEKQFPIVASGLLYENGSDLLPLVNLQLLKDCNFNICMQGTLGSNVFGESLKNAVTCNVTLLFSNGMFTEKEYENKIKTVLLTNEYISGFGGFSLADEPKADEFNDKSELYRKYKKILSETEDYIIYINLLGCQEDQSKDSYFDDYLDKFQQYFTPALFCYDYYPFFEFNSLIFEGLGEVPNYRNLQEGEITEANNYFTNLEIFSEISKARSRPFWTTICSMTMLNLKNKHFRPVEKEQFLRYQVFCALAYGAQGIVYWAYPTIKTQKGESFISALLNRNNKQTASWYFAQKINEEIQQYRHIFLNSTVEENYKTRLSVVTKVSSKFTLVAGVNQSILVSFLKTEDKKTYMLIVNDDFLNYQSIQINMTLGSLEEITPIRSGGPTNQTLTGNNTRILPPGGYRIFLLKGLGPLT